jgi:dTDP-4-amino-4,6-dideoxygalactose transaminase
VTSAIPLTSIEMPDQDVEAVLDTLRSGWLTLGPRTQELEAGLAEWCETPHAIALSSSMAALQLAVEAVGVKPGDEVIIPALTFVEAAAAVRWMGGRPVVCDIRGADDLTLDPGDVAAHITPQTKAVVATHLFGYAADLSALEQLCEEHGLALIENAAEAIGARDATGRRVGTVGAVGCFSMAADAQLPIGEGGFAITGDETIAGRIRSLRSHAMTSGTWDRHRGHAATYDVVDVGFNFRMDEPRAALALSRLPRLTEDIERRRAVARSYRERLSDIPNVGCPWDDDAVERASHNRFAVVLSDQATRDRVHEGLAADGIESTWLPSITSLRDYCDHGACPRAEDLGSRHLLLPLAPSYGEAEVEAVVTRLRAAAAPAAP